MIDSPRIQLTISIHAPVKGATTVTSANISNILNFYPRSREGSDHKQTVARWMRGNFNPRSREGSDRPMAWMPSRKGPFQSTLP